MKINNARGIFARGALALLTFGLALAGPLGVSATDYASSGFIVRDPVMDTGGGYSASTHFKNYSSFGQAQLEIENSSGFIDCNGFMYFEGAVATPLSATAGAASVSLLWTAFLANCGNVITSYELGVSTFSGGPYTFQNVGPVTSFVATGLTNCTPYFFVIRALSGTTVLATSAEATATPTSGSCGGGGPGPGGGGGGGGGGVCGDSIVQSPEQCDAGHANGAVGSSCSSTCRIVTPPPEPPVVTPPPDEPPVVTPPGETPPPDCTFDCSQMSYDLYLVNPDGQERHSNTKFAQVTSVDADTLRYHFDDGGGGDDLDYNDFVVDVKKDDCTHVRFTAISLSADWHHKVWVTTYYKGVKQKTTQLWTDTHTAIGNVKTVDVTGELDACVVPATPSCAFDCSLMSYDLYIVNPDGQERHSNTKFSQTLALDASTVEHRFDDGGGGDDLDYNDIVIDVRKGNCKQVQFTGISVNADWHHQIWITIYYQGHRKRSLMLWSDSHASVGASRVIDATVSIDACEPVPIETPLQDSDLIKASQDTVYYFGRDGKRHPFPHANIYKSWYEDFSHVKTVSDLQLSTIPMGPNVLYRPGSKLIKILSDPKVYAVTTGGVLRWVTSGDIASSLFGVNWRKLVQDLNDAFFVDYKVGEPILTSTEYEPVKDLVAIDTIDDNQGLPATVPPVSPATVNYVKPVCTVSAPFTETLSAGSLGGQVRPLQTLLRCLGYLPADAQTSGLYGPVTQAAVKAFQGDWGLASTGVMDAETRLKLSRYVFAPAPGTSLPILEAPKPAPECTTTTQFTALLTLESVGAQVRALQELLQCLGYFPQGSSPSGYFGTTTEQAVIRYQRAHDLQPVGFVTHETRDSLNTYHQ